MNTISANQTSDPSVARDHDETTQLAAYHTPSALAIAGLLLGLASPLSVLGTLLFVVPLLGAAVSILALWRIAASDGALAGQRVAVIGLILSITCGGAVVAHAAATRHLRTSEAAETARRWIALVLAGDTQNAYLLMTGSPVPDPNQPQEFGPQGNPYHRFLDNPIVKALLAAGADSSIHDEATVKYGAQRGGEFYVRRQYTVTPQTTGSPDDATRPEPIRVLLQLHRTSLLHDGSMTWLATPIEEDEGSNG